MEFRDLKKQYEVLKNSIDNSIEKVLIQGQYIMGEEVSSLEKELADYVGRRYCVSCANGTDAITLLLKAWGIGPGDAVFVPDITFIASAGAASVLGATPIFVDVDLNTFNLDCNSLNDAIKNVLDCGKLIPKAIIAVDLFGLSANYPDISILAKKYNLKILEDSAQGFGGSIYGKKNCSFGDGSITSFFPAKPLGCYGDGGAIFTDNEDVYHDLLSLRVQGRSIEDKYDNYQIGMNSRLDTIQAAILKVKFKAYKDYELTDINKIADQYTNNLKDVVKTPRIPDGYISAYAQYCILLNNNEERNALQNYLAKKNIPTMIYYPKPMHLQKAFQNVATNSVKLVNSKLVAGQILALPISPYLIMKDLHYVSHAIIDFFKEKK